MRSTKNSARAALRNTAAGSGSDGGANLRRLEMLARNAEDNLHDNFLPSRGSIKSKRQADHVTVHQNPKRYPRTKEKSWVELLPKSLADHFVHKSKIAQFEAWLSNMRGSRICLLTGGSGVGKTATVHLVATELGYRVKEWVNPMSLTQYKADGWKDAGEEIQGRSQVDLFTDFLVRSSQYPSLPIKRGGAQKKSLILVEDFPNFFYMDLHLLHQLLRNYKVVGECPLVLVMTDTASSDSSAYKLFPKSLLIELGVQEIALNPVATSYMTKFINSVLVQANVEVDRETIAEIISLSAGDMRSAINNLQFRFQQSKNCGSGPMLKKRKLDKKQQQRPIGSCKDESLLLFHAIGKVLYCKRDTTDVSGIENQMTGKLEIQKRVHPLKEVPEQIGDKIGVAPETFFNFLAQNYLSFFSSLDDVVTASSALADAAAIFSCWVLDDLAGTSRNFKNWDAREEFGLSVAIRGLMFANRTPVGSTWKPLGKPRLKDVNILTESMIQNTHAFFPGPVTQDYYADLIPYAALIRPTKIPAEKREFLRDFGRFQVLASRAPYSLLDEADAAGVDETVTETAPASMLRENVFDRAVQDESEEYEIEEVPD